MRHRVVVRAKADKDVDELALHIARDSQDAALRFLDAMEATFEQLAAMPELGGLWGFRNPRLAAIRVWQVQGFRHHVIFYRIAEPGIEIVRVLHAARDIDAVFAQEN